MGPHAASSRPMTRNKPSLPQRCPAEQQSSYTQCTEQLARLPRARHLPRTEFNLLYDRGVKFGLDGGRIESIMVSAPPLIAWRYNVQPQPGSPEHQLVQVLQSPREWV